MPLTHTRSFRVRNYECDAYGHLNNANYVRYMQETAMDASAAAGFGIVRYAEMGCQWWIRATEIEYLRPAIYNNQVEVKTWVADFRRVSSRRMYEFRLAGTDEMVARGYSDWVFLDTATSKPTSVPPEMGTAFFPEGQPASFPEREPFPVAPPPPPGVFNMSVRVAWKDIDSVQHVNNAAYLEYVEECGMQVVAAHKWPWKRMAEAGFAIFLRKHQIQYLQPALLGDELELSTWAYDVKRSTATRHYAIRRAGDGALLAQVHSLGVWVELASGRPIRIPADLMADFAPNLVTDHRSM
jgi:acyl-CoA thioester hydrolase